MKYKFKFPTAYEIKQSPDNRFIVSTGKRNVYVWDTISGKKLASFNQLNYPMYIAFSYKKNIVAIKNTQGKVAVFDLEKLEHICTIQPTQCEGIELHFTVDDRYIISGDWEGNIYSIDWKQNTSKILIESSTKQKKLNCVIRADEDFVFYSETSKITLSYTMQFRSIDEAHIAFDNADNNRIEKAVYCERTKLIAIIRRYSTSISIEDKRGVLIKTVILPEKKLNRILSINWNRNGEYISIVAQERKGMLEALSELRKTLKGTAKETAQLNYVYIISLQNEKIIDEYRIEYASYAEISPDDEYLLVGGWNNGFCFPLDKMILNNNK